MFLEAEHLSLSVGCVRSKRQNSTVLQNLRLFRWNGWITCSRFMECGDRSIVLHEQYQNTNEPAQETIRETHPNSNKKENRDVDQLVYVDHVPINAPSSQGNSQLYICEDNQAVFKMIYRLMSNSETRVKNSQSCN